MEAKSRNWGIDALKMFSMFLIVVMHTLKQGGVLGACQDNLLMSRVAWLMEVFAFCAVDCYALISGYVGVNTKPKVSKLVPLWLQVFFYTFLITLLFAIIYPMDVNLKIWIKAFFPILAREYWYMSCYFAMVLFLPMLCAGIEQMTEKQFRFTIVGACLLFVVLPAILQGYPFNFDEGLDAFGLLDGYSVLWLIALYLIGAYLKKSGFAEKLPAWGLALTAVVSVLLTWESLFALPKWTLKRFGEVRYSGILLSYTSPTIILVAVCLLLLFAKAGEKKVKAARLISVLGPSSLAVYLIHTHPLIWNRFIKEYAVSFAEGSAVGMVGKVILSALVIYVVCTGIELLRRFLFRVLRLDAVCKKITDK